MPESNNKGFARSFSHSEIFEEIAFAKVNLSLEILARRADGYHELTSLVGFAAIGDRLRLECGPGFELVVDGPFAGAIEGENLLAHVAHSLMDDYGIDNLGVLTLEKLLPVAAGLGGGSADAAALVRLFERVFAVKFSLEDLSGMGRSFGADVPVCVRSQAAIMRGIGEIVHPCQRFPAHVGILLVNPNVPLATAQVFGQLHLSSLSASHHGVDHGDQRDVLSFSALDEVLAYMKQRPNDLTPPAIALAPVIDDCLKVLEDLPGARIARLSGSGATCFALFETAELAEQAGLLLGQQQPGWWIVSSSLRG